MQLHNLKDPQQQVSFEQAVKIGLGNNQGVFFPANIEPLANIDALLEQDFVNRSGAILSHLIGDELPADTVAELVKNAFNFPLPLVEVQDNNYCLELFHGPTLAFKDFGARFMAQCLGLFAKKQKITILTATSGDTGAAVAQAFYGQENIEVVILYPKGKISEAQQKLFTTLGGNIRCFSVDGSFDDCQALVKQAFLDQELKQKIGLNSANSINISRLLAQVCYYFEAVAQLPKQKRDQVAISVPSGNFGNVCAAMIAAVLGLPVKQLMAATNQNDTVPRYLQSGLWQPHATKESLSNAMDVSKPNNWPRVEFMLEQQWFDRECFSSVTVNEQQTQDTMKEVFEQGYVAEPHTAIAFEALKQVTDEEQAGIFLSTAHPAKFKQSVDEVLSEDIELPGAIKEALAKPCLAEELSNNFTELRNKLL